MTRSTDSRRARNSASVRIGGRRRPASRPSRRRCFLASRRVEPRTPGHLVVACARGSGAGSRTRDDGVSAGRRRRRRRRAPAPAAAPAAGAVAPLAVARRPSSSAASLVAARRRSRRRWRRGARRRPRLGVAGSPAPSPSAPRPAAAAAAADGGGACGDAVGRSSSSRLGVVLVPARRRVGGVVGLASAVVVPRRRPRSSVLGVGAPGRRRGPAGGRRWWGPAAGTQRRRRGGSARRGAASGSALRGRGAARPSPACGGLGGASAPPARPGEPARRRGSAALSARSRPRRACGAARGGRLPAARLLAVFAAAPASAAAAVRSAGGRSVGRCGRVGGPAVAGWRLRAPAVGSAAARRGLGGGRRRGPAGLSARSWCRSSRWRSCSARAGAACGSLLEHAGARPFRAPGRARVGTAGPLDVRRRRGAAGNAWGAGRGSGPVRHQWVGDTSESASSGPCASRVTEVGPAARGRPPAQRGEDVVGADSRCGVPDDHSQYRTRVPAAAPAAVDRPAETRRPRTAAAGVERAQPVLRHPLDLDRVAARNAATAARGVGRGRRRAARSAHRGLEPVGQRARAAASTTSTTSRPGGSDGVEGVAHRLGVAALRHARSRRTPPRSPTPVGAALA